MFIVIFFSFFSFYNIIPKITKGISRTKVPNTWAAGSKAEAKQSEKYSKFQLRIICWLRRVSYLSRNSVRTSREELGNASGVEAMLWKPNRCSQPSTASSNNYSIICMIHYCVSSSLQQLIRIIKFYRINK